MYVDTDIVSRKKNWSITDHIEKYVENIAASIKIVLQCK